MTIEVLDLPGDASEHELRIIFGQYGNVSNVEIGERSWGRFAAIQMADIQTAELARRCLQGVGWHGGEMNLRLVR
jgi:hypothetical protein